MPEKKRQEKTVPLPELKSTVTEILVANGRSFQPFIRTFHYTGENISKSNLGSLIGVFEIDETSEDCAYIVNFLASVAKKEYFSNPRRGAIESFEVALHKINLALSELVKHGNVAWLGKLHGTLAVLEKNNLHFSVTGQAKILLLRADSLSDISDGLSSEESHLHPIKTFVEVSSGRLTLDDRVILTSPDLLALFSLDDLTKNARRMDPGQFLQFLKTALVNEFDMAGTLLVEMEEKIMIPPPQTSQRSADEKSLERVGNIFSQSAFLSKKSEKAPSVQENMAHLDGQALPEIKEGYTDTKTGHIYVQGTVTEERGQHQNIERFKLKFEEIFDTIHSGLLAQGKWMRKGKKQLSVITSLVAEASHILSKRIGRALRRLWRKQRTYLKNSFTKKEAATPKIESALPISDSMPPEKQAVFSPEQPEQSVPPQEQNDELPSFIKEKVAFFYQKQTTTLIRDIPPTPEKTTGEPSQTESLFARALILVKKFSNRALTFFQKFPLKKTASTLSLQRLTPFFHVLQSSRKNFSFHRKWLLLGSLGFILSLVALGLFFLRSGVAPTTPVTKEEVPRTDSSVPSNINTPLSDSVVLDNITEPIIGSVILNNEVYVVTETTILTVDKKSFLLPQGSKAKFATAMDDLRLLFVYTENGTLYAWSPIAKTFVENTVALPGGANITGIDTYLTYLYVLDSGNDQVYRFPRAEGGFGAGTVWLKDAVPMETSARLAVNESLFIALDPSTVKGFFRGRATGTLEIPADGLTTTDLYTHPGLQSVYALDAEHQRVIIWNQDGKLIKKLTHEKFSEGRTLSVNEKDGEIFISTENTLLSYKLK